MNIIEKITTPQRIAEGLKMLGAHLSIARALTIDGYENVTGRVVDGHGNTSAQIDTWYMKSLATLLLHAHAKPSHARVRATLEGTYRVNAFSTDDGSCIPAYGVDEIYSNMVLANLDEVWEALSSASA